MEARECGAVVLGIVLAYYGKHLPLKTLRDACGTTRDGVVMGAMVRAARGFGLDVNVFKQVASHQLASYPAPFIIYWKFNHFIVIEGVGRGELWVNDPIMGHRRLALDTEFEEHFTGILITLQPNADFAPGGSPPRLLPRLWRQLQPARGAVLGLGAVLVARGVVDVLLVVWLAAFIMGAVVADGAVLGLVAAHLLFYLLGAGLQRRIQTHLDTSPALLTHITALPMEFFATRYTWEVSSRVSLPQEIGETLANHALPMIFGVGYALVLVLGLGWINPLWGGVGVGLLVLNMAVLLFGSQQAHQADLQTYLPKSTLDQTTSGSLYDIETLRRDGGEDLAFRRVMHHLAELYTHEDRYTRWARLGQALLLLLPWLSAVLMWGVFGSLLGAGGVLLATIALQPLAAAYPLRYRLAYALARLDDVLAEPPRPAAAYLEPIATPSGAVSLVDVTFGYDPKRPPLVRGVSLQVGAGEWVALVGASGSGKSSLLYLMAGVFAPWSGMVQLDGLPAHQIAPQRRWVHMVEAHPIIFDGTVAQNLSLFSPHVSQECHAEAARLALIEEAILAREGAYGYQLDSRNRHFSAGELQCLMIARALSLQPKILLLDEATRTLNPTQEEKLFENLRGLGCTVVMTTHRASTWAHCDRVIYVPPTDEK